MSTDARPIQRLVPFGPDLEHSQFDPRPRKRGRKMPLTPTEQAYVSACEAQYAARAAMVAAEDAWHAATSARLACHAAMVREKADKAAWLEHVKDCPLIRVTAPPAKRRNPPKPE